MVAVLRQPECVANDGICGLRGEAKILLTYSMPKSQRCVDIVVSDCFVSPKMVQIEKVKALHYAM